MIEHGSPSPVRHGYVVLNYVIITKEVVYSPDLPASHFLATGGSVLPHDEDPITDSDKMYMPVIVLISQPLKLRVLAQVNPNSEFRTGKPIHKS
jgi:hypothetical protein